MRTILKGSWTVVSMILTALSLISITQRYGLFNWDQVFIDFANHYRDLVGGLFQLIERFINLKVAPGVRDFVVLYSLFGGAFVAFVGWSVIHKDQKKQQKHPAVRFAWGVLGVLVWPLFLIDVIWRNIKIDAKNWKASWTTKGPRWQIKENVDPPIDFIDRMGRWVFSHTLSTTIAVLAAVILLLVVQISIFFVALLVNFLT